MICKIISMFFHCLTMKEQRHRTCVFRTTVIWGLLFSVLFVTVGQTEARKRDDVHLSCFYCHTLTHGESCNNINETYNASRHSTQLISRCSSDVRYCTVRRFSFSLNGTDLRVWMMERNCSKECTNECIITGDRSKLHLCTSCCKDNMCNFGSGASAIMSLHNIHIATLMFSATLLYLYKEKCQI